MIGWNVPADYMQYVHPHWRTFETPNPFLHYMLGVLYIFFVIFAVAGNGIVTFLRVDRLRRARSDLRRRFCSVQ